MPQVRRDGAFSAQIDFSRTAFSFVTLLGISLRASRTTTSGTSALPKPRPLKINRDRHSGPLFGERKDRDIDRCSNGAIKAADAPCNRWIERGDFRG